jgi:hypothetical protein
MVVLQPSVYHLYGEALISIKSLNRTVNGRHSFGGSGPPVSFAFGDIVEERARHEEVRPALI